MNRRELSAALAASAVVTPSVAQRPEARRIGYLHPRTAAPDSLTVSLLERAWNQLGYLTGNNVFLRSADNKPDRLPYLADELVRQGVGVIIAVGHEAVRAASVSGDVPVVAIDLESDPVASGFVASFSRPGGQITGLFLDQPSLSGKRVDLLRETAPSTERVVFTLDTKGSPGQFDAALSSARSRGLSAEVRETRTTEDYVSLFGAMRGRRTGIIQLGAPGFSTIALPVASAARSHGLPIITFLAPYARAGMLLSYGPKQSTYFPRAVAIADRVLRGAKAADLPIEQPTQFEFILNVKTAVALGLQIPASLLAQADEVIE